MKITDFKIGDWFCDKNGKDYWEYIVFMKIGKNSILPINYGPTDSDEEILTDEEIENMDFEFVPRFTFDFSEYLENYTVRNIKGYYNKEKVDKYNVVSSFVNIPVGAFFKTNRAFYKKIGATKAIVLAGVQPYATFVPASIFDYISNFYVYDVVQMKYNEKYN